ncbi:hypothetical protein Bca4012_051328 [Brassica carinata]
MKTRLENSLEKEEPPTERHEVNKSELGATVGVGTFYNDGNWLSSLVAKGHLLTMEETTTFQGLRHLFMTVFLHGFSAFIVVPVITDVSMAALCPGKDECSLAIYLSGFQQAITGVGSLMMMPLVGSLSDKHGRKSLLTLPMALNILPLAILAYSRETSVFYIYYVLKTFTSIFCEGSVFCLALAYVVATTVAIFSTVYMRIFLPDSIRDNSLVTSIVSTEKLSYVLLEDYPGHRNQISRTVRSVREMASLMRSSVPLFQVAMVSFFSSLSEAGLHASSMMFLLGMAWSAWVPYMAAMFSLVSIFHQSCMRSIVSKQVTSYEQAGFCLKEHHFISQGSVLCARDNSFYLKSDDQSNNSSGSYGISIIPRGPKWRGVLLSLHAVMKDLRVAFDLASEVPNGEEFYCLSML